MKFTRRRFLKAAALTSIGYWAMAGNASKAQPLANGKLGFACFGAQSIKHSDGLATRYGDVVLLCDPDRTVLARAQEQHPKAKIFTDYRKAFDEMEKNFDVADIATPEHLRACISLRAMRAKKHCYVISPLARTIYEARLMGKVAKEMGVVTQMENQGSNSKNFRLGAAQIKAGVLGTVKAVHVWSNRPIWAQGPGRRQTIEKFATETRANQPDKADELIAAKMAEVDKALENLDWENWLGPAPERPFFPNLYDNVSCYPAAHHLGWFDFATGALGAMAFHTVNLPFAGCDLTSPSSVVAKTSGHDFDSFPKSSEIKFEFPATDARPAVEFYWYDGGNKPPQELRDQYDIGSPGSGAIVIGERGALFSPDDYNGFWDLRGKDGAAAPEKLPESELTNPRAGGDGHIVEFFRAVRENKPEECWSNFPDYAAPFAEMILLGNVAVWAASTAGEWGEKIEWDAENLVVKNLSSLQTPGVADLVKPKYRGEHRLD